MSEFIDPTPNTEPSDSPNSVDYWARLLTNTAEEIERKIAERRREGKYPTKRQRQDRAVIVELRQSLEALDYVFDKDSMDSLMGSAGVINRYVPEQLVAETREAEDLRITLRSKNLD
jgi:hypothetical protein